MGREGEREGEKQQYVAATGGPPDWESGPQPKHVP